MRSTRNPTSPPNAISHERDREPAVAHVVHARRPRARRRARRRARAARAAASRSAAGGIPPVSPCTHRGPLRTAELGPGRAEHDDRVARGAGAAAGGASRELVDQPEHADDRRRVDVGAARLVVEGDVAADHRDAERFARLAHAFDDLGELPHHLGVLGIAEVEAVHERERTRARASRRCARLRAPRAGRRCAGRAGRSAPCRRSRARAPSSCPSRAAPRRRRPGRRRCCRNSWWSYWRDTHVLSAIVGVASSASSSRPEVGARAELGAQLRRGIVGLQLVLRGRARERAVVERAVAEAADGHVGDRLAVGADTAGASSPTRRRRVLARARRSRRTVRRTRGSGRCR